MSRSWRQFWASDVSNVVDHTLRVIWLALILSRYEDVGDEGKIMKMALVHDLGESRTGDTHYVSRIYNHQENFKAIGDSLNKTVFEDDFLNLFEEYEKRKCIEAKIVKDADSLDVDLEIAEKKSLGFKSPAGWKKYRDEVAKKYFTKSARELFLKICRSDPHDWHAKGPNRFRKIRP